MQNQNFETIEHQTDLCIVGGGIAGMFAAISAARHGTKVVLINDRPVLGGNASGECRVGISGADIGNIHKGMRETGLLEEIRMDHVRHNPTMAYGPWDILLLSKVQAEPNITLMLNTSCTDATMDGNRITSVTGWQMTTQLVHKVEAKIFADCSGDCILAPLTGAEHRVGREARSEFNESIAPEKADKKTMGMTCTFRAREHDSPQPFTPPPWAYRFEKCDDMPYGLNGHMGAHACGHGWAKGYWWIELGGEHDSIRDTEKLRDELIKIVYGVWDHLKNHCPEAKGSANWALDWVQTFPGKRESRRYVGDHMLTQNDVSAEGRFDDIIAYGGWSMDDHHPAGFWCFKQGAKSTIFHPAPSPYGIPYRILYSRNIDNLMFSGRNVSCTHAAMSSTRVMATCGVMGQAVGVAASIAAREGIDPRGVNPHMRELQQTLLADDCFLPWVKQEFAELTQSAKISASQGNPEPVRDGVNRTFEDVDHCWTAKKGDWIAYEFEKPATVNQVTLALDSSLDMHVGMFSPKGFRDDQIFGVPPTMPKSFRIEGKNGNGWEPLEERTENHQRFVRIPIGKDVSGIRFTLNQTWGSETSRLFTFAVE